MTRDACAPDEAHLSVKPHFFRTRLDLAFSLRKKARAAGESGITPAPVQVATFELVPARASRGKLLDRIVEFVRAAARDGRLCALSITDNAGGHPALSPNALGQEIKAMGMEPIIHFSCKDKNRNEIESQLFELDRNGLHNLLVLTGDYPRFGYMGKAKPVFDLDSVHVLSLISQMNQGVMLNPRAPGGGMALPPLELHPGCVVSPFKILAAEQIPQYLKLKRKIRAGARFVISQLGYDIRKYHELRLFMDLNAMDVPLIGTVFIPSMKLARILHKGLIPGCTFPARLLDVMERNSGDRDRELQFRLELGARLVAALKGIGYEGVHLSGPDLEYEHVAWVLKRAEEIQGRWMELVPELTFPEEWQFFYFARDDATGLNSPEPSDWELPRAPAMDLADYSLNRAVHGLAFEPGRGLHGLCQKLARLVKGSPIEAPFTRIEYGIKKLVYDCRQCGDCTLGEMAFLCPQSQCAKFLLNGPCGGSRNGWCEVWPGKRRCLYVRMFERIAYKEGTEALEGPPMPPRNWDLFLSSSWLNFYLGLDHAGAFRDTGDERG